MVYAVVMQPMSQIMQDSSSCLSLSVCECLSVISSYTNTQHMFHSIVLFGVTSFTMLLCCEVLGIAHCCAKSEGLTLSISTLSATVYQQIRVHTPRHL